tara:strand:+ start:59944 stop:60087 length:144 start_codon:yes stop_codon:yes gene_type:complete
MEEYLNSQEFYELMQSYRMTPIFNNDRTVQAFEAVKEGIKNAAKTNS